MVFVMCPENKLIEQKIRDFLSPLPERYLIQSLFETCNKTLVVEISKFKEPSLITFNLFCLKEDVLYLGVNNKEKVKFDSLDKVLNKMKEQSKL